MTVIAIDGPAGSGKSTVARLVADRLGLDYLDTGAMYRGVAFAALNTGSTRSTPTTWPSWPASSTSPSGPTGVVVDGVDATIEIRGPEVTRAVSIVAANPSVRGSCARRQREWVTEHGGGVVEGRDIGTVVFPDAELKVYLTANAEVRADRRATEVTDLDYETVAADIARRDALDEGRADAPLAVADDAIVIDTTGRSVDEVVDGRAGRASVRDAAATGRERPCPRPSAAEIRRPVPRGPCTPSVRAVVAGSAGPVPAEVTGAPRTSPPTGPSSSPRSTARTSTPFWCR